MSNDAAISHFLTLKVVGKFYLHRRTQASVSRWIHQAVQQTLIELPIKQQAANDATSVGWGGTVEDGVRPDVDTRQKEQQGIRYKETPDTKIPYHRSGEKKKAKRQTVNISSGEQCDVISAPHP